MCGSEDNTNLTRSGKLLLLWHQQLGHASFKLVRWLSRQGYLYGGTVDQMSDIMCDSCRLARATKRTIEKSESSQPVLEGKIKHNPIKSGDLKPGDQVSMDQYSSNTRGQLTKGYGKAPINETYGGGTIFVDRASGYIHVEHQVSLCASDTLAAKRRFERILYDRGDDG